MNDKNKKEINHQVVLLIHGIGEQRPLDSIKGFIKAVWSTNKKQHANRPNGHEYWVKPDSVSDSFELRRFTTGVDINGVRTDFYELYWAHLMTGTTLKHVFNWSRALLIRKPKTVPKHLTQAYWLLWSLTLAMLTLGVYAYNFKIPYFPSTLVAITMGVITSFIVYALKKIIGDAARYLDGSPDNIGHREKIRRLGVNVLRELHNLKVDGEKEYDNIIVVGHSLGSIIGYDILSYYWAQIHQDLNKSALKTDALDAIETMASPINAQSEFDSSQFQQLQEKYFYELKNANSQWRVTDFITLGSPLAHAEILLAKNSAQLKKKLLYRELASCPPQYETSYHEEPYVRFSFPLDGDIRIPHHAALFAATRWTNLYFPARNVIWGDIVGGTLSTVLGKGIVDLPVDTDRWHGIFSHTFYWSPNKHNNYDASHLDVLRDVVFRQ